VFKLTTPQEESFNTRPSVRIVMPDNLKSLLVDDWEQVTKNQCVVSLPAKYPVRQILQDWHDEEEPKRSGSSADEDVLEEVVAGLQEYFDKCLDKILLYRHERQQYRGLRKKFEAATGDLADKGPIDVYGAEHLIRLFSMYYPYSVLTFEGYLLTVQRHHARAYCSDEYGYAGHQPAA
jgi:mortality factor 4-like protein 1